MNSVGDAFSWPFRDPGWVGKLAVQALILIIPIVGWISTLGWLMMAFDNLRNGRQELPPAGFHLGRGIGLFGVLAIYGLVLNIPAWILDIAGSASARVNTSATTSIYYNSSPLSSLGSLWSFLAQLFLYFLLPSLIVLVYHSGFGGGMDVGRVWKLATSNPGNSVIGGLVIFVAGIIGFLGIIACCIGIFFTLAYATLIQAGVAAWFERVQSAPPAPSPPLPGGPA